MLNVLKILIITILISITYNQTIYEQTIYEDGVELDVFAYQIPENFNTEAYYPLLIAFHQWGGNQMSPFSTNFDDEANSRNWIFMSPFGGSSNNYNHQGAQYMVQEAIQWMMNNYNIDKNRIYVVGGSMGGASGMIYANNHLNPTEPMIAATASASGILDCERRAIEMDGNNSMTEWFGGNYDDVPFEYHRNSAIYFADSTQSMHYNLKYTPLYFDFGTTEPHRTHAEEMYELMIEYNANMWIDEEPTGSHGFTVFDENHVCDWLAQFELINDIDTINVNLDEPSRAYWLEAYNQLSNVEFIKINAHRLSTNMWDNPILGEGYGVYINEYTNSDSLILHLLNEEYSINENITLYIEGQENNIGFTGSLLNDTNLETINAFLIDSNETYCSEFFFNINENVIWIERYDTSQSEENICISNLPYKISFDFLVTECNLGDINSDSIINILDIVSIVNFILGETSDEIQECAADYNEDGIINVLDIILIVNLILN